MSWRLCKKQPTLFSLLLRFSFGVFETLLCHTDQLFFFVLVLLDDIFDNGFCSNVEMTLNPRSLTRLTRITRDWCVETPQIRVVQISPRVNDTFMKFKLLGGFLTVVYDFTKIYAQHVVFLCLDSKRSKCTRRGTKKTARNFNWSSTEKDLTERWSFQPFVITVACPDGLDLVQSPIFGVLDFHIIVLFHRRHKYSYLKGQHLKYVPIYKDSDEILTHQHLWYLPFSHSFRHFHSSSDQPLPLTPGCTFYSFYWINLTK